MAKLWKKSYRFLGVLFLSIAAIVFGAFALAACGDSSEGGDDPIGGDGPIGGDPTATYTVTYDANGGSETPEAETVQGGSKLTKPTDPTKEHYDLDGWYNESTKWNFDTDTVQSDMTLTAHWTAIVYTIRFVGFEDKFEKTYTVENINQFEWPAVPEAPEHYENPTWNKTKEECLIYSEEVIVVNAEATPKKYTVTFANTEDDYIEPLQVTYNTTFETEVRDATRSGFLFAGWYLENGEKYDFEPIQGNLTLVARWVVANSNGTKYKITAQDIYDNAKTDPYTSKNGLNTSFNGADSWYYDSDYLVDNVLNIESRRLAVWMAFGLTNDANAPDPDRTVTLPALNYYLYNKVDFGLTFSHLQELYVINADGEKEALPHANAANNGAGNQLISIVEKEDGIYLIDRTVNDANITKEIKLPEDVATGKVGISLIGNVTAWSQLNVSEFHVWPKIDYIDAIQRAAAELPTSIIMCYGDLEELLLIDAALTNEVYLTDYEKEHIERPAIIAEWLEEFSGNEYTIKDNFQAEMTIEGGTYDAANSTKRFLISEAGDHAITLPAVNYSLYEDIQLFFNFSDNNKAGGISITAYGTTLIDNLEQSWYWLEIRNKADGIYLAIYFTGTNAQDSNEVKLPDEVVYGQVGLQFTFTTTLAEANNWIGLWDNTGRTSSQLKVTLK